MERDMSKITTDNSYENILAFLATIKYKSRTRGGGGKYVMKTHS